MNEENEKDWNPGHSTHKGYPYAGVVTKQTMPNRPALSMGEDKKIYIDWNPDEFTQKVDGDGPRTQLEDFLLFRLYDYQEALLLAEGQIVDFLSETPFIPEKFGFEIGASSRNDIHTPPVQIYVNKYDESISIYRTPGDSTLDSFNPSAYTLLKKKEDGIFNEVELSLPCARITYATLYALGVQMSAPEGREADGGGVREIRDLDEDFLEFSAKNLKKEYSEETNKALKRTGFTHVVEFIRKEEELLIPVTAADDKDAMTQAKFLLETDNEHAVLDVNFEELKVVKL